MPAGAGRRALTDRPGLELDHLVVAAASLEEGAAWLEPRLGAALEAGGRHDGFGTHNRLLSLGTGAYLELIAPDPAQPDPPAGRPFGLDEPALRERLADGPALLHWVARTDDLDALLRAVPELGAAEAMRRGPLAWRIALRPRRDLLDGGLVPTPIAWGGGPHPAAGLPDRGVRLLALRGEHPEPARVGATLDRLGAGELLSLRRGAEARLEAVLRGPAGEWTLPGR